MCAGLNIDRGLNNLPWGSERLFLCERLSEAGLPDVEEAPMELKVGRRIGIDYAEEAVDFPWRFYL